MGELTILKTEFLMIKKQILGWNAVHFADFHCIVCTGHGYVLMMTPRLKKIEKNASYTLKEVDHMHFQLPLLGCEIAGRPALLLMRMVLIPIG